MQRRKHITLPLRAMTLFACVIAAQASAQGSGEGPTTAQEIWRHLPPLPGLKSETASLPAPSEPASTQTATEFMQPEGMSGSELETNAPDMISGVAPDDMATGTQLARPPVQTHEAIPQEDIAWSDPSQLRLAVYVPERSATDQREQTIEWLSAEGWTPEEAVTPVTVGKTHVRYFHPQDRAAAQDLAAALNADARDFVSFTPSPEDGYLELWLGGPGAPPVTNPVIARGRMTEPYKALTASSGVGSPAPVADDRGDDRDSGGRGDNPWLRPFSLHGILGRNKRDRKSVV